MIRVIGFVDTLPAAAAYHGKFKALFKDGEEGSGLSWFEADEHDWKTARNLVARVQSLVAIETEEAKSHVFALEPGHAMPWDRDDRGDGRDRFVVALAVGPGAGLQVGPHAVPLVVGQVLHFNPTNLHTVSNFGPVPLVALAVDLRDALHRDDGSPAQADS